MYTSKKTAPAAVSWCSSSCHTPDVSVRSDIRQLCELYGARVVDTQESEIIIELSEVPSRIDAFLDVISNFKILEMSRSVLRL